MERATSTMVVISQGQDLRARKEWELRSEDLARHAIGASKVASIRDGDPEIPQGTVVAVQHHDHDPGAVDFKMTVQGDAPGARIDVDEVGVG